MEQIFLCGITIQMAAPALFVEMVGDALLRLLQLLAYIRVNAVSSAQMAGTKAKYYMMGWSGYL